MVRANLSNKYCKQEIITGAEKHKIKMSGYFPHPIY